MRDHVHVGVLTGLATFASVIIAGTLWRATAHRLIASNPDSKLGPAMLVVY